MKKRREGEKFILEIAADELSNICLALNEFTSGQFSPNDDEWQLLVDNIGILSRDSLVKMIYELSPRFNVQP